MISSRSLIFLRQIVPMRLIEIQMRQDGLTVMQSPLCFLFPPPGKGAERIEHFSLMFRFFPQNFFLSFCAFNEQPEILTGHDNSVGCRHGFTFLRSFFHRADQFDGIITPQIRTATVNFPDGVAMTAIMVSRSDATEWQTDIFFQFDFQNTAGTVPGIIKTTGRVLGEKQIAAAATFGKAVAFIEFQKTTSFGRGQRPLGFA